MQAEDAEAPPRLHSPPRSAAAPKPRGILKNANQNPSSASIPLAASGSGSGSGEPTAAGAPAGEGGDVAPSAGVVAAEPSGGEQQGMSVDEGVLSPGGGR
jgi:hypothetical protein